MPGFNLLAWTGMFGPAKMPPEVVATLERELKKVLEKPEILEKFRKSGFEPLLGR